MPVTHRDKRIVDSERSIESAFLRLKCDKPFGKISITDVCREAGVSRSTFYERYGTMDDLLYATIDHIVKDTPLVEKCVNAYRWSHLKAGTPLCIYVRSHPETHGLFYDPEMHSTIVDRTIRMCWDKTWDIMSRFGDIGAKQYENLLRYQMAGCLSMMAQKAGCCDAEWELTRKTIDNMILINLNNHTI